MATLFEIGSDVIALEELLSDIGGDVTDEQVERAFDEWFAEIGDDVKTKLDSYVTLIAEFEARAEARKAEAQRLGKRAITDSNKAEQLRARLKIFFERTGKTKIETARYTIAIAKNGGKIPVEIGVSPDLLPIRFQRIVTNISADTDALRAMLEAGEELSFARLGERGTHLRIK